MLFFNEMLIMSDEKSGGSNFLVTRTPSVPWEEGTVAHPDIVTLEGERSPRRAGLREVGILAAVRGSAGQDAAVGGKAGPGHSTGHSLS